MNPFDIFKSPTLDVDEKNLLHSTGIESNDYHKLFNKNREEILAHKVWKLSFREVLGHPVIDAYSESGITYYNDLSAASLLRHLKSRLKDKGLVAVSKLEASDYYLPMAKIFKRDQVWRFKLANGNWLDIGFKSGRILRKHTYSSRVYLYAFDGMHRLWFLVYTRPLLKTMMTLLSFETYFYLLRILSARKFGLYKSLRVSANHSQ